MPEKTPRHFQKIGGNILTLRKENSEYKAIKLQAMEDFKCLCDKEIKKGETVELCHHCQTIICEGCMPGIHEEKLLCEECDCHNRFRIRKRNCSGLHRISNQFR